MRRGVMAPLDRREDVNETAPAPTGSHRYRVSKSTRGDVAPQQRRGHDVDSGPKAARSAPRQSRRPAAAHFRPQVPGRPGCRCRCPARHRHGQGTEQSRVCRRVAVQDRIEGATMLHDRCGQQLALGAHATRVDAPHSRTGLCVPQTCRQHSNLRPTRRLVFERRGQVELQEAYESFFVIIDLHLSRPTPARRSRGGCEACSRAGARARWQRGWTRKRNLRSAVAIPGVTGG